MAADARVDADFVVGTIGGVGSDPAPEGGWRCTPATTATDEALAPGGAAGAPSRAAALPPRRGRPAAQAPTPAPYAMPTRHGILRERLADTLTDGLRASLMRQQGYRADVGAVRGEPAHAAQHDAAGRATGEPGQGGSVRKGTHGSSARGLRPKLAEPGGADLS